MARTKQKTQTPEERKRVAKQRASREARGQKAGNGEGFVPPKRKGEVEVRRLGTREEVVALEDRPGVTPPELPEQPKIFKTEEGELTTKKESIFQKEGEAPPSVTESVLKSAGIGAGIGLSAYGGGRLVTSAVRGGARLIASRGLSSKAVAETAKGKLTSSIIKERIKLEGGKVLTNTYTVKKGISLLSRLSKAGKYALGTFGILSGIAFAGQFLVTQTYNDSADAIDGYKFAISQADRDDNDEEVQKLGEEFDELYAVWEETNGLEIFNYPKAANNKIQQSKDVVDSVRRRRGLQ
jgi:hypothetical protein